MTSDAEITHCGRTVSGNFVAWDLRWEGDLPEGSDVVWAMVVSDGVEEIRLVHEQVSGGRAQYVAGAGGREDVDPDADVSDHEITVRFRADVVGVAVEWPVWTAVLTVEGVEVSTMVVPTSS
jgi:hypothetical protein